MDARWPYKKFELLLHALHAIADCHADLRLCVVGRRFTRGEDELIAELGLEQHLVHFDLCSDADLARLYVSSVGLVHTSLYEGFGIPIVEAMTCGTSVVAADTSSIPEVLGDAGLRFDPKSRDELVDRMVALLEGPALREQLIKRGRKRARHFTWERTATATLEVYRSEAGGAA